MVRSFQYAAGRALMVASRDRPAEPDRLAGPLSLWSATMIERFLAAYGEAAAGSRLYPDNPDHAAVLIRHFALEKALYEIRYELHHRPDWAGIPIQGVLDLL
jgi:maltose alpha-D-glucosyltransferase/alpha-amylase